MARQTRDYKLVSYVEELFYNKAVHIANVQDQSVSDYIRDLIIKDLHEKGNLSEEDFAEVVYNSANTRLSINRYLNERDELAEAG